MRESPSWSRKSTAPVQGGKDKIDVVIARIGIVENHSTKHLNRLMKVAEVARPLHSVGGRQEVHLPHFMPCIQAPIDKFKVRCELRWYLIK